MLTIVLKNKLCYHKYDIISRARIEKYGHSNSGERMKLEKFKFKNIKKISINLFLIGIGLLLGYFLFGRSYALYEENKNFDVINGSVEDPGDIYFAYYIDGEISREMPKQNTGYTLDETKSNCTNGVKINWNHSTWQGVTDYTSYSATTNTRTKCTLYFNKTSKTVSTVLGNIEVNNYTPDFTKSACDDESCESHEKGIYETTDYDGNPTYYYRGSVENNYVKFAGYYWRIIRINSNGSIRMIYDGTSAHDNGEASSDRQYGTSRFNPDSNDNMYVGYMYATNNAHGITMSSVIKNAADKFYTDNLTNYTSRLDFNIGYCGDRSTLNLQVGVGTGTITTYYKGYFRVEQSNPTLSCENNNDYYTTSQSENGNGALTYPIGLITADEIMLAGHAGGVFDGGYNYRKSNLKSYLTTGNGFWTMTPVGGFNPYNYSYWGTHLFPLYGSGYFDDSSSNNIFGLRPVINIRSDVTITGSGTKTDPYVVS